MRRLFLFVLIAFPLYAYVAVVGGMRGEVFVVHEGKVLPLHTGDKVYKKDEVFTKKGMVQLIFKDETVITIGQKSRMQIVKYLYDRKPQARFFLKKGVFRTLTGKIGKIAPKRFKLKTKNATIGIRGTEILVRTLPGQPEYIACTLGAIEVVANRTSQRVGINVGKMVIIRPEGDMSKPMPLKPQIFTPVLALQDKKTIMPAKKQRKEGSATVVTDSQSSQISLPDPMMYKKENEIKTIRGSVQTSSSQVSSISDISTSQISSTGSSQNYESSISSQVQESSGSVSSTLSSVSSQYPVIPVSSVSYSKTSSSFSSNIQSSSSAVSSVSSSIQSLSSISSSISSAISSMSSQVSSITSSFSSNIQSSSSKSHKPHSSHKDKSSSSAVSSVSSSFSSTVTQSSSSISSSSSSSCTDVLNCFSDTVDSFFGRSASSSRSSVSSKKIYDNEYMGFGYWQKDSKEFWVKGRPTSPHVIDRLVRQKAKAAYEGKAAADVGGGAVATGNFEMDVDFGSRKVGGKIDVKHKRGRWAFGFDGRVRKSGFESAKVYTLPQSTHQIHGGEVQGGFYGPNAEAAGGTFRLNNGVHGAFGGMRSPQK